MTNVNDMMYVDFDELDSNKTETLPHFDNSEFNNTTHRPSGYHFFLNMNKLLYQEKQLLF